MSNQFIDHQRENLARVISLYRAGDLPAHHVTLAAEALLHVLDPAAIEDVEYPSLDWRLEAWAQCRAAGEHGRRCTRRRGHVSLDHRDLEVSWPVEETAAQTIDNNSRQGDAP